MLFLVHAEGEESTEGVCEVSCPMGMCALIFVGRHLVLSSLWFCLTYKIDGLELKEIFLQWIETFQNNEDKVDSYNFLDLIESLTKESPVIFNFFLYPNQLLVQPPL